METLDASLRLLRPVLPGELVDGGSFTYISDLGARLAPIHCAGFEVRLDADSPQVDLIQRIRALGGEPQRLRRHIEKTSLGQSPSWNKVAALCAAWEQPDGALQRHVAGAFLELDADGGARPSLYLSLQAGAPRAPEALLDLLQVSASLLRDAPLPADVLQGVGAVARALPDSAAVTDVGFMLARDIDAVRLVVAPLLRQQVAPLLAALDWHGDPPNVDAALPLVPGEIEHLALSLDVGARVLPRAGLEYYPGPHEHDVAAWQTALGHLVEEGLCCATKRDALLRWPGYVEPTDSAGDWPAALLVESLLNRADQFIVLARRLTFLKLVCTGASAPVAKAYFGYGPRSFAAPSARAAVTCGTPEDGRGAAISLATMSRSGSASATRHADGRGAAIAAAAGYLLRQRDDDGMWREFPRILKGTDEWASAYIGTALAQLPRNDCTAAARGAWEALVRRRGPDDGWGYNADLPPDADSTLWALELADAAGQGSTPRARAGAEVLARHVGGDGGVATYDAGAVEGLRRLLGSVPLDGFLVAHTCVSAAAARRADLAGHVLPFVRAHQDDDGRWRGYWWSDDEYTTALAVTALRRSDDAASAACVARAQAWAAARLSRGGAAWSRALGAASPFATALCVDILGSSAPQCAPAVDWLLATQQADGAWPASAIMRMPPPTAASGDAHPRATTVSVDDRSLFTTATVLRTLVAASPRAD